MDRHKGEESGEMYSPDEQGEYGTATAASSFTVQGLSDALTALDPQVTKVMKVPPPKVGYALQLEVTMADWPGQLQPPPFSWNAGMVMHVLKGDPALHNLEHIQVDRPGTAYLFFYGFSTTSEAVGGRRRCRRQRNEKHLAPTCLDMTIFKTIDPNADITYTIWNFDVEGWLDQYDEVSMMPDIYHSLQGYPGKWMRSLEEGWNISAHDLLRQMGTAFGSI